MSTKVIHRFLRNPNFDSNKYNRVANRFNPFQNTLVTLRDPANDRTLTLIGTTNSSSTLAYRTKNLLNTLKPDALYVQTSQLWWDHAKHTDIDNQQVFNEVSKAFPQPKYKFQNHLRGILFRLRYYVWKATFEHVTNFNSDFNAFTPGLETYFACRYATENKVPNFYGQEEFDVQTIEALRLEPDLYPHTLYSRWFKTTQRQTSSWDTQTSDFMNVMHVRGGEAFAESMDRFRINFLVSLFKRAAPKQKKIIVDERDVRIFKDLYYNMKDKKNIVAIVNQWHMEGVETHWRNHTGTTLPKENLSPVADMPIDDIQEKLLVNEWLRSYTSQVCKTEPATWQDYLINYHKQNYENERTRHTHHDTHEDIPEPGQKSKHHH